MFCIYCRKAFDEKTETVCSNCGGELFKGNSTVPAEPEQPPETPHEPEPQPEMPYELAPNCLMQVCKGCGTEFPVLCPHCGKKPGADTVIPPEGWLSCEDCRESYWVICPHCQRTQEEEPEPEPPPKQTYTSQPVYPYAPAYLAHTCSRCGAQFPVGCSHCGTPSQEAAVPPEGWLACYVCNRSYWVICPYCQSTQEEQPKPGPESKPEPELRKRSGGGHRPPDIPFVPPPEPPPEQQTYEPPPGVCPICGQWPCVCKPPEPPEVCPICGRWPCVCKLPEPPPPPPPIPVCPVCGRNPCVCRKPEPPQPEPPKRKNPLLPILGILGALLLTLGIGLSLRNQWWPFGLGGGDNDDTPSVVQSDQSDQSPESPPPQASEEDYPIAEAWPFSAHTHWGTGSGFTAFIVNGTPYFVNYGKMLQKWDFETNQLVSINSWYEQAGVPQFLFGDYLYYLTLQTGALGYVSRMNIRTGEIEIDETDEALYIHCDGEYLYYVRVKADPDDEMYPIEKYDPATRETVSRTLVPGKHYGDDGEMVLGGKYYYSYSSYYDRDANDKNTREYRVQDLDTGEVSTFVGGSGEAPQYLCGNSEMLFYVNEGAIRTYRNGNHDLFFDFKELGHNFGGADYMYLDGDWLYATSHNGEEYALYRMNTEGGIVQHIPIEQYSGGIGKFAVAQGWIFSGGIVYRIVDDMLVIENSELLSEPKPLVNLE